MKQEAPPKMLYCGCHGDSGHYVWRENGERVRWGLADKEQPWGKAIDGGIQPLARGGYHVPNGVARYTQEHGWSALSWWDNSIDTRPGSHSTFVIEGVHSAEFVLVSARIRFPWVFERFPFDVSIPGGGSGA